jgi:hypothetical protein
MKRLLVKTVFVGISKSRLPPFGGEWERMRLKKSGLKEFGAMARLLTMLMAVAAIASPSIAEMITFEVKGNTLGAYPDGPSPGGWEYGTPIMLTYTFDSTTTGTVFTYDTVTTVGSSQSISSHQGYYFSRPITDFHLEIGSASLSMSTGGVSDTYLFYDNGPPGDRYIAGFYSPKQPTFANGVELSWFQIDFYDPSDWLSAAAALPTSPAGLSACAVKGGRLLWNNGVQESMQFNSVSSPSAAVPEIDPAGIGSVLALVSAALGLLERRRLKVA